MAFLRRLLGPQPELRLLVVLLIVVMAQLYILMGKADDIDRSIDYIDIETCGVAYPCEVEVTNTVDVRQGY